MLQTMRHLAQTPVFKAIMLLLVISFSIWGIGDIFRGNPLKREVAKVGGMTISVQTLNQRFSTALENVRRQLDPSITRQQAVKMGILDGALDNLIEDAGLRQEIEHLGINVSDKEFLTFLATQPRFVGKDGKIDRALFRQMVESKGMSERVFLDEASAEMAREQLINTLRSPLHVPQIMADNLYRARAQKRVLDVVTIKNDDFSSVASPDDKTLHDYFDQNQMRFAMPEFRAITVARLSADDLGKDISVSDEDVKKEFDSKVSTMVERPERRDVIQVVAPTEEKAKELIAAAKDSGDLTKAAKKLGLDALPIEKVEQKGLLPGLTNKIFALAQNEISEPIQSGSGWQVIQVKKIDPAMKADFNSLKDRLRADLQRDRAIEKITGMLNDLDDQLAGGHALEDIADGMKLRIVKIPAVDTQGKTPEGKTPAELPEADIVLKAAFGQNSGEVSPVLDDKHGNYDVVRTDSVIPSAVPPLEKIKGVVVAAWSKVERANRAAALAEDIAKGMRDGKTAASFAGPNGVTARVSNPVSLSGDGDPDLPENAMQEIFKMKKYDVVVVPLPDSQLVLKLTTFIDADPAAAKAGADKLSEEILGEIPAELVGQYIKYMRVLYPVEINQSVLDSIRQEGGS